MKKIIGIVWISLVVIGGLVGTADAYTAEVKYSFQGLDIDLGKVFSDPTMIMIVNGKPANQLDDLLKPPEGIAPDSESAPDVYFERDPLTGTSSLVFLPESLQKFSKLSVGGEAIEIPEIPNVSFPVPINDHDIVVLTAKDEKTISFQVDLPLTGDGVVTVSTIADGTVPEPSTLVLLGLGLVGFLGFKRWRKNGKRGQQAIKTLLLLAVIVGMTGVFALSGAQPALAQFSCGSVTEIPQAECQALVALYNSTGGANWRLNTNWLQTSTPCDWSGVTCDSGHVTKLWMRHNSLNGSLPPEIGNLGNLQDLSITYNSQLSGSLPAELGNLSNLSTLDLEGNRLSGGLPAALGSLMNLQILDLHSNYQLSGSIPAALSNLTNLQVFELQHNQLSGSIPSGLGSLSNLKILSLSDNQLSGSIPPALGSLANLQILSLHSNQLTGSIPTELGNLSNLSRLELGNNQLSGNIPSALGSLSNLHRLELYSNQLTGSIPTAIGNLTELMTLFLMDNQLSGSIPSEIGNLTKLGTLWLHNNQLSGSLPPALGNLTNLWSLYLYNNQLSGNVPPELGNLGELLRYLDLSDNQLYGQLPANLTNISRLLKFYFHDTNLCEPQDAAFQSWLAGIQDVQGTGAACSSFDYFVYDEYGGTYEDVDKTPQAGDDEEMCWNFSGSNILHWRGWNIFSGAQDIADDVKTYWTNAGGMAKYLWRWWMDGNAPPDLGEEWSKLIDPAPDPDGGDHWDSYDFEEYYYSHWHKNVMAAVKDYLHSGYGVGVTLYDSANSLDQGHALTVWGYRYYEDGTVIGLWVTDSDDAASEPPDLRLLPVTYQAKWIDATLYELKWRVAEDGYAYQGWLIDGVQALKPRDPNSLRVRKVGTGTGSVVSTPAGIDCGADCVELYSSGTPVTLSASPESDSNFVGWQGACSGTGNCTVTVNGEMLVTAIFESTDPTTFTITTSVETGATVTPAGVTHAVPAGADATFVFTSDAQYRILDVRVDGYSVGPVSAYTFSNMSADHTLEVKTIPESMKLAITRKKCVEVDEYGEIVYEEGEEKEIACTPGNNATIYIDDQVCDSECMRIIAPFAEGDALILQAVPDENNEFLGWEVNGELIPPEEIDEIFYTLEDILVKPVIGCNHD